jgi:hypothetical protein
MALFGRDVFLVGENFHAASALTNKLYLLKFHCHFANTMRAAAELLSSRPVDLVLSNMYLPDGTGVGLLPALARLRVDAFLSLRVENSCLWLPAINGGRVCLGAPALRPLEFRRTLEDLARCLPVATRANKPVAKARIA